MTQQKHDTKGWKRFFNDVEGDADLATLINHLAYLLYQPPALAQSEIGYLERRCHDLPAMTTLRILNALCALKRVGTHASRPTFVAGLFRHPHIEVRHAAIDLAFEWGSTSVRDGRPLYWLLRQRARSSDCTYAAARASELYMKIESDNRRVVTRLPFRDVFLQNMPQCAPLDEPSPTEEPLTQTSRPRGE